MVPRLKFIQFVCLTLSVSRVVECAVHSRPHNLTYDSPEEVLRKWTSFEDKFQVGIVSLMKEVLPNVVRASMELDLTDECTTAILKVLNAAKEMQVWALKMLDAAGKPSGGQLSGTFALLGSFQECLETSPPPEKEQPPFVSQYCLVEIRPALPEKPFTTYLNKIYPPFDSFKPKTEVVNHIRNNSAIFYYVAYQVGLCLPSTCTNQDVHNLGTLVSSKLDLQVNLRYCTTAKEAYNLSLDANQITVFGVLFSIFLICVVVTVFERLLHKPDPEKELSLLRRLVKTFSLRENFLRTVSLAALEDNTFSCLCGMRFITVTWVILAHSYVLLEPNSIRYGEQISHVRKHLAFQVVANGALSVETFFFITGVLVSYHTLRITDKRKLNLSLFIIMICRRVWRLLPGVMLGAGLVFVLPLLGSGPLWLDEVGTLRDMCQKSWWYIPLFVNNFVPLEHMCLTHTWYVSSEVQLFLIAIIYFIISIRKPRLAVCLNLFLMAVSVFSVGYLTWHHNLFPAFVLSSNDKTAWENFFYYVYFPFYTHWCSYGVGLALGTYFASNPKLQLSVPVRILFWILAAFLSVTTLYGTIQWNSGRQVSMLEAVFYSGLHRIGWCLGLALLTALCVGGYGGIVNTLLSWKIYNPLNRLTYLVYILHYLVIVYFNGIAKGAYDFSHENVVRKYLGNVVISFILAFFFRLIYEAPLTGLDAIVFKRVHSIQKSTSSTENDKHDDHQSSIKKDVPIFLQQRKFSEFTCSGSPGPDEDQLSQIINKRKLSKISVSSVPCTIKRNSLQCHQRKSSFIGAVLEAYEEPNEHQRRSSDNHYTLNLVLEGLNQAESIPNDLHCVTDESDSKDILQKKLSLKDKNLDNIITENQKASSNIEELSLRHESARSYSTSSENDSTVSGAISSKKSPNIVLSPRFTILHKSHA